MRPKILIILQNFYGDRESRFNVPVYDTRIINRKNATYVRIVPYLEDEFELWFSECTPFIADNKVKKFKTDLNWVKSALSYDDWFAVIAFGTQASKALQNLNYTPFATLPHPVSYAWRKAHIEECRDNLVNLKKNV